jgi:hypothetical protein
VAELMTLNTSEYFNEDVKIYLEALHSKDRFQAWIEKVLVEEIRDHNAIDAEFTIIEVDDKKLLEHK